MKKNVLILGVFLLATVGLYCQNDYYEFLRQRSTKTGFTTFFDVVNLDDSFTADLIISDLLQDENISRANYFKLKNGKDRIHIFYDSVVDANYIRPILQYHDVDFDLSTVIKNGEVQQSKDEKIRIEKFTSKPKHVKADGFPQYKNTGHKDLDNNNYRKEKDEWINNNPQEYELMLQELQEKTEEEEK